MKLLFALFLLLAAFWLFAHWRAARHEAHTRAAFPPLGQIIEVDGHRVHALVMGPQDGSVPDLVLIHGSGGNLRDFSRDFAPRLAREYRVILLDRPGHGYTDRIKGQPSSLEAQAHLLAAAARRLGAEKPVVLGHSFGGAVALAWAVYEPESMAALVPLAAPSHPWTTGVTLFYHLTGRPLTAWAVNPALAAFVPDSRVTRATAAVFAPDAVPDGYLDHFGAGLTLRRSALLANARQRRALLPQIKEMVPLYPGLALPVEIIHGDADSTVSPDIHARRLLQEIPDAALTLLPGIGHMPHHAAPDAVIAAIHRAATRAGLRPAP